MRYSATFLSAILARCRPGLVLLALALLPLAGLLARPVLADVPSFAPLAISIGSADTPYLLVAGNSGSAESMLLPPGTPPNVTAINPTSGPIGSTITLTGTNLNNVISISFNGMMNFMVTTGFTVNAAGTSITGIVVPSGAFTGGVVVTNNSGITSSGIIFTVTAAATAPVVTTAAASAITAATATLGGNVTADGGATITERGVVYVLGTGTPTITNNKLMATGTTGTFTVAATGLTASTTYNARAYAINSAGTSYGSAVSFTTSAAEPSLTSITPTTAAVGSTITINGISLRRLISISFSGTANNTVPPSSFTVNTAGTQITGVVVPAGAVSGNVVGVYTTNGFPPTPLPTNAIAFTVTAATTAPTVTTAAASAITDATATLGGNVTADGGATVTERGVVYVLGTATPTITDTKAVATGTTGAFTVSATGLTASTTYNVRAYAINSVGTSYGSAMSFTTSAAATTVVSLNRTSGNPTKDLIVEYRLTFAGPVTGLTASNFSIASTGLAGTISVAGVSNVAGDNSKYAVSVNAGTGSGTLTLTLANSTGLSPAVSNVPFAGQTFTIDRTAPTVAISSTATGTTGTSPIPITVTFSEVVSGFNASKVTVTNGTLSGFSNVGATFTFNVTPAANGAVTVNVAANVAQDAAGNDNTAASAYTITYAATVAPPTLTAISPTSGVIGSTVTLTGTNLTGATTVTFTGTSGNTVTTGFTVNAAGTSITGIVVPTGATTGNVTVTTASGTSSGISFTVTTPATAATVTTAAASALTATSATLGGDVNADGGATVTERGVVYVLGTATPTTTDTKLTATGTTGTFTLAATGLTASTTYNARAYAINSVATSYGSAVSFTTTAAAATSLTVSTGTAAAPTSIAAGTYSDITVTSTGFATLGGAVVANGPVVVNGGLNTSCQALTGTGSFTLAAGGTLGICDAAGITASGATGAVQLSGTRSFSSDANYIYNGTTDQETGNGLPAAARNLAYANTSANTLTLTQPVAVAQVLTVSGDGNFETNGNGLTLRSTATGTALLVNSGTAKVTNEVTAERYIDPTRNAGLGYRHLVPSVNSDNLNRDLASGGGTITRNVQYNSSATPGTVTPFPTIFAYDPEQQTASVATTLSIFDKGWVSPSPRTLRNTGFTVQLTGGQTLSFKGTPQQGNVPLSLERNLGVAAADGGWNLVGNPYAAPLDFSTVTDAQRTDMDAAVYIYESTSQYVGQYLSYLMPTGANPGVGSQPLAGSAQGFFLRVNAGSATGSLNLTDANRVTTYAAQQVVRRNASDTRPQVQLALAGNGLADELTVYATAGATAGLDSNYDAAKLANPNGLNLASLTTTGQQLAIDGRPVFTTATSIPLFVGVPAAGSYTFTAASLANLAGTRAELVDNLTNSRTTLTAGASYAFTTATTTTPGRFWLNLTPAGAPLAMSAAILAAQVLTYPNPAHNRLTVLRPAGAATTAVLLNALGQVVRNFALPTPETTLDVQGLATGVYVLRLTLDGQPVSKRVVIE